MARNIGAFLALGRFGVGMFRGVAQAGIEMRRWRGRRERVEKKSLVCILWIVPNSEGQRPNPIPA